MYNADGTLNQLGKITDYVEVRMTIMDHSEKMALAVTKLWNPELFLGLDWLRNHNLSIDWAEHHLSFDQCPNACGYTAILEDIKCDEPDDLKPTLSLEEGDRLYVMDWDVYIQQGAMEYRLNRVVPGGKVMEMVNDYIKEFKDVFSATELDQFPERLPWDHVIELTPGFKPVDCEVYPLNHKEQQALDKFLNENLRSGRIRPSKSPMTSPPFCQEEGWHPVTGAGLQEAE